MRTLITRHPLLAIITFLFLFTACEEKKQNVVFILVDDLGWKDVGYSGSTFYETPHIDALSKSSIQFTKAYASGSICSPTRAAILTGKHPVRLNITDWIPGQKPKNNQLIGPEIQEALPLQETTLSEAFKKNGYKTFFAGKWHLGGNNYLPEDQGFDINYGGHDKGSPPGGYYAPYNNPKLKNGPPGEYLTDRLTDETINFIQETQQDPFFVFLSFYTVHTPIQANKKYIDKFQQKLATSDVIPSVGKNERNSITRVNQNNPSYASMIYALDQNIGRLISALKEKDLYDGTIIVFTSDNGGLSTLSESRKNLAPTSNLPLRAGKGWLYEGGIRIPLLIKPAGYKGVNKVIDEPIISHDLSPTLQSMSAIGYHEPSMDGLDISPLMTGKNSFDRKELFWHYPHYHGSGWTPGAAILQGEWKLIEFYESGDLELYNLADDPYESKDLSSKYPTKATALQKRLRYLQDSLGAQYPIPNPNYND